MLIQLDVYVYIGYGFFLIIGIVLIVISGGKSAVKISRSKEKTTSLLLIVPVA